MSTRRIRGMGFSPELCCQSAYGLSSAPVASVGRSVVLLVLTGLSCAGGWLLIRSNPQMSAVI